MSDEDDEEEPGVVEGPLVPELGEGGGSRCSREICSNALRGQEVWR